ncbi:MAG: glucans biosynthesis glucosyltransferase MdoH [Gammaproteobacteria bacterium]|nr:MAG: glucans biosynthesis glucosyltransferase MdoH [Gammaproteobacteria bacterium]
MDPNWKLHAWLRRLAFAVLVIGQVILGTRYLIDVLPYHGRNLLELSLTMIFALMFAWISIGFWMGVYGFALRLMGGDRLSLLRRHQADLDSAELARTAIVMPIYNESIQRSLGGLRAVYLSLQAAGKLDHFDFFILSDSRHPDVWLLEQTAWYRLCRELKAEGRLFYRRRSINMHYKTGNIADFLRRWGRNYEYTIVLDADSLMDGATLVRMVQLMQLEPRAGIVQTNPLLVNGKSLFARVQQFSSQAYGPLFGAGLAALQLGEAVYWGHNAILRTAPFMRHCGLRDLGGKGLFGGPILSHDFVEAAFMGRAGYEVWLEPGMTGSYEESPPTLVDELSRDKRWAKGNLQHLWLLLFEPRLKLAHRLAFVNGIMSYASSLLWLAFLALTTIEIARLKIWPINYFPVPYDPFPSWPEWHPLQAVTLGSITLFLLFTPKFLALAAILAKRRQAAFAGSMSLAWGILLEIMLTVLFTPIRMLSHSRYLLEAMFNVNLAWAGQNRTLEATWRSAFIHHLPGALLALAWTGFSLWLGKIICYWTLPVSIPLMLAAPISVLTGRSGPGARARRRGLLRIPEETTEHPLLTDLQGMPMTDALLPRSAFIHAVLDPVLNKLHCAVARRHERGVTRNRLHALRTRCLENGPDSLSEKEISLLVKDKESLAWLHSEAWRANDDSVWGRLIHTI